jgi:hypothetical protein
VNDESDKLDMEKEWRKGGKRRGRMMGDAEKLVGWIMHCFFMRRTIGRSPLGGKGKIDPR